ncbi:hypothetical protein B0H13DRAFT_1855024 [Mycena leptocephala]|nr:hypothetical protein B0H13DRAFT_1855024 [Mycena leptocephala]
MTRSSSRKISASIAKIAAQDLLDSGEENDMDVDKDADKTLVQSGEEEEDDKDEDDGDGNEEEEDSGTGGDTNEEEEEDSGTGGDTDKEEEEDSDDNNNGSDVVVIPRKRKRSGSGKKSNEPKPRDIEYKFAIFSAKEMKKSKSSRSPATEVVVLKSNVSWATLKTNILTQINEALDPSSLIFHDYNITFTVPRQVSDPMQLSHKKYDYLVKKALQIQKNPSVKVIIEQKGFTKNKENGLNEDEDDVGEKRVKKSKVPKARDILPANVALNEKIGELRNRWICPTPGGPCGSAHCYYNDINPEHMPLSHVYSAFSWLKTVFYIVLAVRIALPRWCMLRNIFWGCFNGIKMPRGCGPTVRAPQMSISGNPIQSDLFLCVQEKE